MKFQVTQSHIDAANEWLAGYWKWQTTAEHCSNDFDRRRSCNCPASRALLEHTGLTIGQVSFNYNEVAIANTDYRTTGPLKSQIHRWDCSREFEPGEYEIVLAE